eukprot:326698-Prymnesium_polylepis.2
MPMSTLRQMASATMLRDVADSIQTHQQMKWLKVAPEREALARGGKHMIGRLRALLEVIIEVMQLVQALSQKVPSERELGAMPAAEIGALLSRLHYPSAFVPAVLSKHLSEQPLTPNQLIELRMEMEQDFAAIQNLGHAIPYSYDLSGFDTEPSIEGTSVAMASCRASERQ